LKNSKESLTFHKQFWDMAKVKKKELEKQTDRFEEGKEQLRSLDEKRVPLDKELRSICKKENEMKDLDSKICNIICPKENMTYSAS
jgi:hypothetical protein